MQQKVVMAEAGLLEKTEELALRETVAAARELELQAQESDLHKSKEAAKAKEKELKRERSLQSMAPAEELREREALHESS